MTLTWTAPPDADAYRAYLVELGLVKTQEVVTDDCSLSKLEDTTMTVNLDLVRTHSLGVRLIP
jgi:hypothetical protein